MTLSVAFLANEHPEVLPMRLYPPEFMSIAQSGPPGAVFRARIVDVSVTSENAPLIPPPAAAVVDACAATELRTTVEATVVSVLSATNAAPPKALASPPEAPATARAEFRAMVEFWTVADPPQLKPPESASASAEP